MSDTRLSPGVAPRHRAPDHSSWTPEPVEQSRPESADGPALICVAPASQALMRLLEQIAPTNLPVMISGESGTGKEVVARHIHKISERTGAFVSVDCSVIAEQLAASEPGAGRAAFDARPITSSDEWFAAAHRGTLFLDELAELPSSLQGEVLRILGEIEAVRANARDHDATDVRVIAATRVDVSEVVSAGHFSLDLFYRLNISQVRVPPLRQRREDITALADHFLRTHAMRLGLPLPSLSRQALAVLNQHPWTRNIRELENVIRCALLVAPDRELGVEHLKLAGVAAQRMTQIAGTDAYAEPGQHAQTLTELLTRMFQTPGTRLLESVENQVVAEAFRFTGRNQVRTATVLGISRNVLRTLLRKHGLFNVRRRSSGGRGSSQHS
jgi:DNA-binding NtrC family response regulator